MTFGITVQIAARGWMKKIVIEDLDNNSSISIEEKDDGYTYLNGFFENLRIYIDDVEVFLQERTS